MVATRLSEVAVKGYEWASGSGTTGAASSEPSTPLRTNASSNTAPSASYLTSPSALWDAASNSLSNASTSLTSAADQAYSTLAGVANYAWESDDSHPYDHHHGDYHPGQPQPQHPQMTPSNQDNDPAQGGPSWLQSIVDKDNTFSFGSPWKLHQNPYNRVRGRGYSQNKHASLSAVRSLLPLVAENNIHNNNTNADNDSDYPSLADVSEDDNTELLGEQSEDSKSRVSVQMASPPHHAASRRTSSPWSPDYPSERFPSHKIPPPSQIHQNSETASQLAEGTVRALRDIALDEAVEFHAALRFWSERWEHPLLSWLEAGPTVWLSRDGYDHQVIGQKVAKIQAVLARRCTAIGELQQHLLRAGWQRGVAQWGVLGHGGQWATVQGTYVMTEETAAVAAESSRRRHYSNFEDDPENTNNNNNHDRYNNNLAESVESLNALPAQHMERIGLGSSQHQSNNHHHHKRHSSSHRSTSRSDQHQKRKRQKGYYASVFVRNEDDGKILMDDAALAEWSVDAMALIRNLLVRASNGKVQLPYEHHWKNTTTTTTSNVPPPPPRDGLDERQSSVFSENSDAGGQLIMDPEQNEYTDHLKPAEIGTNRQLPIWAQFAPKGGEEGQNRESDGGNPTLDDDCVVISNLPRMAAEVSSLLNSIEDIMPLRRFRRMRKLRPPSMFRRRWYLTVVAAPCLSYMGYQLISRGLGSKLVRATMYKIYTFFEERVYIPFVAIIEELIKGRDDISDKKARLEVIAGLKEMIRSWLDDNHPEIDAAKRLEMAELMDISLIERKKAESMKTIYELNQAVRLSFIEMQFIKKEMVNALYTMDDMMTKNEINTNLAAVTPAVILLYTTREVFRFFYYALLKLGKSKEECYASFRQILTDIERLLVMRDNPPTSPFPPHQLRQMGAAGDTEEASQSQLMPIETGNKPGCDVLSADDLGMLMLHIHECRTILWDDYSRFSPAVIQSVSEDLAELAGERGAVSVQQQLQIIGRMCRTYPFLKVISIGTTFHQRFISTG